MKPFSLRVGLGAISLAGLSFALASCATHSKFYANQDHLHGANPGRAPAAAVTKVNRMMERLTARYAVMEQLKREFDSQLVQKNFGQGGPLDQDAYYKIRTAWSAQQAEVDGVLSHYQKTLDAAIDGTVTLDEAVALQQSMASAISGDQPALSGVTPEFSRHALSDLGAHFSEITQKFSNRIATNPSTGDSGAAIASLGNSVSELREENRKFNKLSEDEATTAFKAAQDLKFQDIFQEINLGSAETKIELNRRGIGVKQTRKPATDAMFYPTAAPYPNGKAGGPGNLFGYNFKDGVWAITFDDGPHPTLTAQVRANLEHHGYKSTFFMLADCAIGLPSVLKAQRDDGFDLASHSWSHANLMKASAAGLDKEVTQAKKKLEELMSPGASGPSDPNYRHITLMRLPYGSGAFPNDVKKNPGVMQKLADNGLIEVTWNVDTLDWQDHDPDSVYRRTMQQIHELGHGIILFHDVHPQSVIASNRVMDWMKAPTDSQGHRTDANGNAYSPKKVCTVQGIIDEMNGKIADCQNWVTAIH